MDKPVTCVKITHKKKVLFDQVSFGMPFVADGLLFVKCDLIDNSRNYNVNAVGIGNNKKGCFDPNKVVSFVDIEAVER